MLIRRLGVSTSKESTFEGLDYTLSSYISFRD